VKPILVADCVSKVFRGRRVLSSGSLRAVEGELRVLLGRNGAGKSTLLKIAAGWIQPDTGVVHFGGEALLTARLPHLAARGLFYLPDHDLFSSAFSVRGQLELFRRQFAGAEVDVALDAVGLPGLVQQKPSALSGGELRRAEIAAIMVRRPRCLLADEPFRGITPKDAEELGQLFKRLSAGGMAIVVTGHEVPTLMEAADHVTWCTAGTSYELGSPGAAMQHEGLRRDYLGQGHALVLSKGDSPGQGT
jgi:lipopolysaccharide export system ATP-binding protein